MTSVVFITAFIVVQGHLEIGLCILPREVESKWLFSEVQFGKFDKKSDFQEGSIYRNSL